MNSCSTIDSYVSNLVSFPHYIAKSSNYLILKTIDEINEKTLDTLDLIVTGAENIIIFALEMIVGTYACVLVSTIDGAVDVAVNSTESIITWVNDTLGDITDDIADGLADLSKFLNKAVNAAEKVKDFFDGDDDDDGNSTLSNINLTVSSLKNFHIPSSVNTKLESLKENTPDFDEVKNKTEALIKTPFELIKNKIANTTVLSTEGDSLYVSPLEQVKICSDNSDKINGFYNQLAKDISSIVKLFVALLVISAILVLIPIIYEEYRLWRKLSTISTDLNEKSQQLNGKDPIETMERTFNKYPTALGIKVSQLSTSPETQTSIRWITSYILSSRALILLGTSLAGILAVILQYIILTILVRSISKNKTTWDEITDSISNKIEGSISNWTDSTNDYLESKEDDINDDLFKWVKIGTDSVNDTISSFITEMNDAISDAFNGTILYAPVKTIVGCVIEDKLVKIEKGLTWIHDNAEITLPRVSEEYITDAWNETGNGTDSSAVSKASALMTETENLMGKMLKAIITEYKKSLMLELCISLALWGIWVLQFLIGLVILYFGGFSKNKGTDSVGLSDIKISYPRQLTAEEQEMYGYPLTGNLRVVNLPTNPFTNAAQIDNPFGNNKKLDDLDEKMDSKSTLTTEKVVSSRRITRVINPFDEFESDGVSRVLSRYDDEDDEKNDLGVYSGEARGFRFP